MRLNKVKPKTIYELSDRAKSDRLVGFLTHDNQYKNKVHRTVDSILSFTNSKHPVIELRDILIPRINGSELYLLLTNSAFYWFIHKCKILVVSLKDLQYWEGTANTIHVPVESSGSPLYLYGFLKDVFTNLSGIYGLEGRVCTGEEFDNIKERRHEGKTSEPS